MRILEIIREDIIVTNELENVLINTLYLLNQKVNNNSNPTNQTISFATMQQLIVNQGFDIDYNDFVKLYDTVPAISNLVDSFSEDEINFSKDSAEIDDPEMQDDETNFSMDSSEIDDPEMQDDETNFSMDSSEVDKPRTPGIDIKKHKNQIDSMAARAMKKRI